MVACIGVFVPYRQLTEESGNNVSNRKKVNVKGIRFVGFLHSGNPVFGVGFVRRGGRRITIQNPERGYPKAASGGFETDERIKPKAREVAMLPCGVGQCSRVEAVRRTTEYDPVRSQVTS